MTIEIVEDNNAIALRVGNELLTGDDAKDHEAKMFFGEEGIIWRSEHARWEITFNKGTTSPLQSGSSFGPGTENDGSGGAAVGAGQSPALRPELLQRDDDDRDGSAFAYTIRLTPNGSNTTLTLDPRVRIFRRGRRNGEV